MAVVYLGRDERLDRLVALKLLASASASASALAADEAFRARFIRESRAAAVQDPRMIPVFGAGEADGLLYTRSPAAGGGAAGSGPEREGDPEPDRPGRRARW